MMPKVYSSAGPGTQSFKTMQRHCHVQGDIHNSETPSQKGSLQSQIYELSSSKIGYKLFFF